ncbi:hypothetical protein M758_1G267000 [Ceratodon purpureus]|nr:hypothetical protein M758_1G267000 [Ceratodon purpureus]
MKPDICDVVLWFFFSFLFCSWDPQRAPLFRTFANLAETISYELNDFDGVYRARPLECCGNDSIIR